MKSSPAFQFYVADFLVGTAEMTAEEVGGYIRLLCYQWSKGGLPIENKKLMQLSGLFDLDSLNTVKTKFIEINGLLKNERIEKTRGEQDDYRLKQSEASKKSWENRRLRNGEPMASHTEANGEPMPTLMASQSSLPSTSSTTITNTKSKSTKEIDYSFLQNEPKILIDAFRKWVEYKKEIKNTYKSQTSLQTAFNHLKELSGLNYDNAMKIVNNSIANQYKGLFALKENQTQPLQNVSPPSQYKRHEL
jgi:uncharacterized protein YdaU (DUF1376 family)